MLPVPSLLACYIHPGCLFLSCPCFVLWLLCWLDLFSRILLLLCLFFFVCWCFLLLCLSLLSCFLLRCICFLVLLQLLLCMCPGCSLLPLLVVLCLCFRPVPGRLGFVHLILLVFFRLFSLLFCLFPSVAYFVCW